MSTVGEPLYGHQEGAVVGYNPTKPERPSHTYQSYLLANLRLVLEVEIQAGNQQAAKHSAPGLWRLLDRLGPQCAPWLLLVALVMKNKPSVDFCDYWQRHLPN
jgi:hypothetical protein